MNTKSLRETGSNKTAKNPIKIVPVSPIKKPDWIRIKLHATKTFQNVKEKLRESSLHTVCEEATCPNISECFSKGTATFMILGDLCTRRCPFCDVAHGRPDKIDQAEPERLANAICQLY